MDSYMNYLRIPIGFIKNHTLNTQIIRCICRAKIIANHEWNYNYYPTCERELQELDRIFYCLASDEEMTSLAQR